MNYTKGEWFVEDNKILCKHTTIKGTGYWFIAQNGTISDPKQVEANAHLIAAAPDEHEALVGLVDYLEYMGVPEDCEDKYQAALEALAKAENVKEQ